MLIHKLLHIQVSLIQRCPHSRGLEWRGSTVYGGVLIPEGWNGGVPPYSTPGGWNRGVPAGASVKPQ